MSGSDTAYDYGEFGSVTREKTNWTDGSSRLTENTYWSDIPQWHLNRLLETHVTKLPAAPALERTSSFQYDKYTALLTQEVIEPNLPSRQAPDLLRS